jgi:hypothetical protein
MCTALIHRGKDVIFGFNMDISMGALDFDLYATEQCFFIGCPADTEGFPGEIPSFYRVADGVRKCHGVNSRGMFAACLNNMNCHKAPFRLAEDACSLDQVVDDVLSGQRTLEDVRRFAEEKEITTLPAGAVDVPHPGFHSLMGDREGHIMVLEPGNGYAMIREKYAVMSNFPLLHLPEDLKDETAGFYGRDRYDTAVRMLQQAGDRLSPEKALEILDAVKQTGTWATRVSFVYSCNEKTVRYCREGDFNNIRMHRFQ